MILAGDPGHDVETQRLATFTLDCGPLMIPSFRLMRTKEAGLSLLLPSLFKSNGEAMRFCYGTYREVMALVIELYLLMGGKFPDGTVAPPWLEMDGDPSEWGGLVKREPEAAE